MPSLQIENRISGDLSRTMVSNIATPINMIIRNAQGLQAGLRNQQIRVFPAFADGKNRLVFTKEKFVPPLYSFCLGSQQRVELLGLDIQRLFIYYSSEILITEALHFFLFFVLPVLFVFCGALYPISIGRILSISDMILACR